ncbi:MAG TPA: hypothetical protein VGP92_02890 [Acidimicrobiia bacterium]|nr:hypothetical protein [Acidimicrobiia bacterium]
MAVLHALLAEGGPGNLWNPTIIGVATVLCAVGLFCGSTYLLLGTNLGARLGFLVAAAGLSGFLVLLTTLWLTTPGSATGNSDLDPPHGNSASWKVVEIVASPTDSKIPAVRDLPTKGTAGTDTLTTQVKPAIDAAVVPAPQVAGQTAPVQPFATLGISSSTDYLLKFPSSKAFQYIDKTQNFFWHRPRYAAMELCLARLDATGSQVLGANGPVCDPLKPTRFAVLKYDYGSVRKPVVFYWLFSLLFFGLSLLGLHWWEQDERARKRAALAPVPAPSE